MVQCAEGTHTKSNLTFRALEDIPPYEVYQICNGGNNGVLQAGSVVLRSGTECLNVARGFIRLNGTECEEALTGAIFQKVEF